jgi:hypothetical protein
MLQFYFLSIAVNLIAGLTLSSDWLAQRFAGLSDVLSRLETRKRKMALGLFVLLVGFGTLFVPAAPPFVLGDLFPSLAGMAMGIALLFEVLKQDALFPAERADRPVREDRAPVAYRTTLGILGISAALLHFFLPERPIL